MVVIWRAARLLEGGVVVIWRVARWFEEQDGSGLELGLGLGSRKMEESGGDEGIKLGLGF